MERFWIFEQCGWFTKSSLHELSTSNELFYNNDKINIIKGFPGGSVVKNPPTMPETQETWVLSLGWENPLEEGMATYSSILAWRIPWTEEPDRIQFIEYWRVGHDWSDLACMQYKEALFDNSEETSKSWGWLRLTNASKNHYSIALQNKSDYSGVLSGFGFWINRRLF